MVKKRHIMSTDQIEVRNGEAKAVFVKTAQGWSPQWFYEGERRMLRFKDHEWLSVGQVHPLFADSARLTAQEGARFSGTCLYGTTRVAWTVTVSPDPEGPGFEVVSAFKPVKNIELLEAFTAFETPYEYDGSEAVITVPGQNPAVQWSGTQLVSPPVWKNPAWMYSRPQAVRCTGPCNAPILCQAIAPAEGLPGRCISIVGDWNVCDLHDLYCTPTRKVKAEGEKAGSERHGYKYIVGALNWSSAYAKDPNVLFEGGRRHTQRLLVSFSTKIPGDTLDAMLIRAWERAAALDFPANGRVAAFDRVVRRGITWGTATQWLRDVFCGPGVEDFFYPDRGICTYATGTRPKAGGDYSWAWWPQWAGLLHFRALMTGDRELTDRCERFNAVFSGLNYNANILGARNVVGLTLLPSLLWARGAGKGGSLARGIEPIVRGAYEGSRGENDGTRAMDNGGQAASAEGLLLAAGAYDAPEYAAQGLLLLREVNHELDHRFWDFNCGQTGNMDHGGQLRPLGVSHAVAANLEAYRHSGEAAYLTAARRFARYLISILYTTHNGSADPDFDWRGWANGSNGGRDQIAEFPPWETCNGFMYPLALLEEGIVEPGLLDTAWYFARTGLAQFPAARSLKRVHDRGLNVQFLPRRDIASERDYYDSLPYLAYENPLDQTLLASYQGTDCLLAELMFAGGLAHAEDTRLGVIVPAAARLDPTLTTRRTVHVWNPLQEKVKTRINVTWPDGRLSGQSLRVEPRSVATVKFVRAAKRS
jgi:hypothetical protein